MHVFDQISKCHLKILLGDFKLTIRNGSLHEICNDSGVRAVNSPASKYLLVKCTIFSNHSIS
jgi:hypothetical protein